MGLHTENKSLVVEKGNVSIPYCLATFLLLSSYAIPLNNLPGGGKAATTYREWSKNINKGSYARALLV